MNERGWSMAEDSGWGTIAAIVLVIAAFKGCSSSNSTDSEEADYYAADATEESPDYGSDASSSYTYTSSASGYSTGEEEEEERAQFDEDAARDAAENDLASETYTDNGSPYGCTVDCSGHEAGWKWRAENGYSTYGNSQSFSEGGQAFDDAVGERVEEMKSDYESGEEPEY